MKTFESLLVELARHEIRFILVGGLAVELCGFSRTTIDMDIMVDDAPDNLRRLLDCLANFGEGHARELSIEDFTPDEGCIQIVEAFPLDIFTRMSGNSYHDLLKLTDRHQIEDVQINYLNRNGLILLKQNSHRPKDKVDVEELRRLGL